ncbi:MAG TPA: 5-deoxy-glucuronate isomerase, partial [Verrucomicrobiota bacterium]|nr:5-deoxy-glucuronate isomerase [Verrucomicrobiota bacterium]
MKYTAENLVVRPGQDSEDSDLILDISPELAGWDFISFQVRKLVQGSCWTFATGNNELAFVNLTGRYRVESSRGQWTGIGGRNTVFESAAHALYLPRNTEFTVTAEQPGEFAVAWVPATQD